MTQDREAYREQARSENSMSAWAIRHPGGMYFAGFGGKPNAQLVKWGYSLAEAKLFNATALSQADKYIERIKQKDPLYIGMKVVKVSISATDGGKETNVR